MKLTEHIYYYRQEKGLPIMGMASCNTFVIKDSRGLVMTDPGPSAGPHLGKVIRCMERDGLRFEDVRKIVLTHGHLDHAAVVAPLAKKLNAEVLAHPYEIPLIENPEKFLQYEYEASETVFRELSVVPRFVWETFVFITLGKHYPYRNGVVPVKEGYEICEGITASVVELPGHRPGEIGIHFPDEGALLTGDLINTWRGNLPSLNLPLSDLDHAAESIEKIRTMGIEILAPAHEPFIKGAERINRWLEAVLLYCESMKKTAKQETANGKKVSLWNLGEKLRAKNPAVAVYENPFIAFAALKSIGYYAR